MKKLLLTFLGLAFINVSFAQTYNPDFLDGRIMFKLKGEVQTNKHQSQQIDKNSYTLIEDLNDYPELKAILEGYNVTKFERPSYFTSRTELMKIYRVTFSDFAKIDALVETLANLEYVEFASKTPIYKTGFVPNDTYHSGTNKWYHTLVGSEAAWNISQGRAGVKVAIVDGAVAASHQDLATFKQYDVADNDNDATPPQTYTQDQGWSHGTHCAGLATASINNNLGIASLGGNVELIGIKTTPDNAPNSASVWYGYSGVQWACQNGAHVVSMSYGGNTSDPSMQALINAYPEIVFIAAAGNDGNSVVNYPAGYANVIGVGSVNSNDSRSSFSSFNGSTNFVDIAAPGGYSNGGLLSCVYTSSGNSYAKMGGTSMATPFAAGLVGLMLSENPSLTPTQILNCLTTTGVTINQNIGPRINALAAMQCVAATVTGDPIPSFTGVPTTITEGQSVTFYDNSADGGNAITNWQWSFPGGTPSSFVGQNPPTITYATAGTYNVSLQVTNSQDSVLENKTSYINVSLEPYGEWIEQATGFATASRGINYISIVDANVVWATAYDGSATAANVQEFTKTTNGGLTWTPGTINLGNTGLGIAMIHAYDANTAWIAAYPNGGQTGGIWKTINGGSTWNRQPTATYTNAASFTNVVHFWDANTGFCQGDPINGEFELYTTTDGGTNWTLVPGANIPTPLAGEYGYTRQIEVVGNTVWFTTNKGRVFHSTDKGLNWSVYQTPLTDFGSATQSGNLSFKDATTGLIIDNSGVVYKSVNSGATWTTLPTTGTVFTNSLCYVEGTDIVFSTGAGSGSSGSSYSEDGGATWNIIDTEQHLFVEFINQSVGWSGWFNTDATTRGMWKWNDLSSPLDVAFNGTPFNVCVADTVNFTDLTTGGTATSWLWSFPGGTPASSTQASPSVTYATPGIYPVSLTVGDGTFQSTHVDTAHVTAVLLASTPSAISGNATPCAFSLENYTVTNVPDVFYNWTLSSGWTGTSSSNSINVTVNDTSGTLTVTADNVCGSSPVSTISLNIPTTPTANFSQNDNGVTTFFTSTSTNATAWSWDFGDTNGSSSENPNHVYASTGTYTVTLIAMNACGDADTTSQQVSFLLTSTEQILDEYTYVRVYPNPASDVLTIDGLPASFIENETIEVIDVLGRTVITIQATNEKQNIDISNLTDGVYTLSLKGKNKAYKFVKS